MRKMAIIAGVALGIAVAGCSAAPPRASRPVARTATTAATPSVGQTTVPAVCQPGGAIFQLGTMMTSAMEPSDDEAMWKLLTSTAWPSGFQTATWSSGFDLLAAQMAHDISYTDGPGAGTNWGGNWDPATQTGWDGPAMGGSPASLSKWVRSDLEYLTSACPAS